MRDIVIRYLLDAANEVNAIKRKTGVKPVLNNLFQMSEI